MRSIMQTPNVNNINKVLKSMNIENVKINNAPNYIQDIVAKLEKAQNRNSHGFIRTGNIRRSRG